MESNECQLRDALDSESTRQALPIEISQLSESSNELQRASEKFKFKELHNSENFQSVWNSNSKNSKNFKSFKCKEKGRHFLSRFYVLQNVLKVIKVVRIQKVDNHANAQDSSQQHRHGESCSHFRDIHILKRSQIKPPF